MNLSLMAVEEKKSKNSSLDDKLVWGTRQTFFGGHFELRYQSNAPLKINRISIYDTGFVQPGEKRKSRLQLPQ